MCIRDRDNIGYQSGGWTIHWQGGSGDITPGTTILDAFKSAVSDSSNIRYSKDGGDLSNSDIIVAVIGEKSRILRELGTEIRFTYLMKILG